MKYLFIFLFAFPKFALSQVPDDSIKNNFYPKFVIQLTMAPFTHYTNKNDFHSATGKNDFLSIQNMGFKTGLFFGISPAEFVNFKFGVLYDLKEYTNIDYRLYDNPSCPGCTQGPRYKVVTSYHELEFYFLNMTFFIKTPVTKLDFTLFALPKFRKNIFEKEISYKKEGVSENKTLFPKGHNFSISKGIGFRYRYDENLDLMLDAFIYRDDHWFDTFYKSDYSMGLMTTISYSLFKK